MSVHLHVRSCYSLLSSTLTIPKMIESALKYGFEYLAICDYEVLHGIMPFYKACKQYNLKPLYAMELKALYNDKQIGFIMLAKNNQGLMDLMKLSTYIKTNKEIITLEHLAAYSANCVVILHAYDNDLEKLILQQEDELNILLKEVKECFSNLYASIANNDNGLMQKMNYDYKRLLISKQIKTVAISSCFYQNKNDEQAYHILQAINKQTTIEDKKLDKKWNRYFYSSQEMNQLYDEEDLIASDEIAKLCSFELNLAKVCLPHYHNRYQVSSEIFLKELCHKGLTKRLNNHITDDYLKRLEYELKIILEMGFEDYFLIVYDYILYAKSKDIYVGAGRGSAAGSLVAYCLGITNVDPIKYNLLFERFLNPERISMPDIDCDFPDNHRDEVIEYVHELYGDEHVAHILTFNTLGAKAVLRDVGKALGISLRSIELLTKLVPNKPKITLREAYQESHNMRNILANNPKLKQLFDLSLHLEGLPRHYSLHAAGVVLADESIVNVCPLMKLDDGMMVTQYTKEYLEDLGLIKFDFLGIRNLTTIDEIIQNIKLTRPDFDIYKIPYDDVKTYALLSRGDNLGIFQLESEGMKKLFRKMKPNCFEDIVAAIALYRPGPMEYIDEYLLRRSNPSQVVYPHADIKDILAPTYGIIIYQEQIMQIAQTMAGFSLGKADILRKAISKKHGDELALLQDDFINGAIQKGYNQEVATSIYDMILKFANYGFNRSHSVAYAMIAYQMAYLKANASGYFYCSLLNSVIGSEQKLNEYVFEVRKQGIKVLPPNINYSTSEFMIENKALRFPLSAIKGIKYNLCRLIIEERNKHGLFLDFFDAIARLNGIKVNRKCLENLIHAGAFDEFNLNRASMIASLGEGIIYGDLSRIEGEDEISYNFKIVSKPIINQVHDSLNYRCEKEKEVLGLYLSNHPLTLLREQMAPNSLVIMQLADYQNQVVRFMAIIDYVKTHRTKHGDLMAFVNVHDEMMQFDLVVMPNIYQTHEKKLIKGNYLYIEALIESDTKCLVRKLQVINLKI